MKQKKDRENYIDNKRFFEELLEFKKTQVITDYIGECFQKISKGLASKSNFSNYPFVDDMISDGVLNCLTYINGFDENKSSNPFSYFTQIIYYSFLRYIAKEKKVLYTKFKYLLELEDDMGNVVDLDPSKYISSNNITHDEFKQYIRLYIDDFEKKHGIDLKKERKSSKRKSRKKSLLKKDS